MSNPILNAAPPSQTKLELLRQHFPQAVETDADGRIRINAAALQIALDPGNPAGVQVEEDGYELRWVGKREAYHSAFVPVQKILAPLPNESKHWDSTGNLLIKGDNLDALRLLRHSYFGKVKLIYIDPPYNTQSDAFIYRDDFSVRQSEVLAQLGYTKDNIDYIKNIYGARTHSGWLSFMYPRLLLAKDLLRDDGVIFISIDDNEQAQLKLLCDEVFGQENFVTSITTQVNKGGRDYLPIAVTHETLLCYVKDAECGLDSIFELSKKDKKFDFEDSRGGFDARELRNRNPKFTKANRPNLAYEVFIDPKSADKNKFCQVSLTSSDKFTVSVTPLNSKQQSSVWRWGQTKFAENNTNDLDTAEIFAKQKSDGGWNIYEKHRKLTFKAKTIWDETGVRTEQGTKDFKVHFDGAYFEHPKSLEFLKKIVTLGAGPNDICLDFFAGSGTTAEAVMRLNAEDGGRRQFILVQIPQPIEPKKQKEAHHFVSHTLGKKQATIFEITAERIRRSGARIEAEQAASARKAAQTALTASAAQTSQSVVQPELSEGFGDTRTPADTVLPPPAATSVGPVDTGFRVFDLTDDPNALILQMPLQTATQADLQTLQVSIATPQPALLPRILYNLLLAEGLPLSTLLHPVKDQHLYLAVDVLLIVQAVPLDDLIDTLRALQASGTPALHLTVYAPWVADDNFMLGIKTVAESLGYSSDKLRLRG